MCSTSNNFLFLGGSEIKPCCNKLFYSSNFVFCTNSRLLIKVFGSSLVSQSRAKTSGIFSGKFFMRYEVFEKSIALVSDSLRVFTDARYRSGSNFSITAKSSTYASKVLSAN
jgi:hypothetical protein